MNLRKIKKIPTSEEIIQQFPLSEAGLEQIAKDRQEIKDILAGKDDRMIFIIGPCSAWPREAVIEYATRLKACGEGIKDKIKLVLRVYIQKPRTTKGWTGPVNQPDPLGVPDIEEGMKYSRSLMVRAIEMGLPIADEALFTHNAKGFLELLSWVAVGARSTEDQEHRIFASAIECAVGMKNPTSGSIEIGVNSIIAAQYPHTAVFHGYQVETGGNPYAHLVLRGGDKGPNYGLGSIEEAARLMEKHQIKNPAIIIDASHDNCKIDGEKSLEQQENIVHSVIETRKKNPQAHKVVKGFMVESFLKPGSQKIDPRKPEEVDRGGLSITDPCLGWQETEDLLKRAAGVI
ncbi:MAG: 3-deoxy-7-phosphoheptulonate synthase [Candidatus Magasanikbacteria bacterium]|nr:3-deoxy-7-phosphoheptulonate synthase [Candidatus Magasanikbacteria bacterium]